MPKSIVFNEGRLTKYKEFQIIYDYAIDSGLECKHAIINRAKRKTIIPLVILCKYQDCLISDPADVILCLDCILEAYNKI